MRGFLKLLVLAGLTVVLGCGGAKPGGSADAGGGGVAKGGAPAPAKPAVQFKPASQLKAPEGVAAEDIADLPMPKSAWVIWSSWSPGDIWTTETANEGTVISRSRLEVTDIADHAIMNTLDTTIILAGNETKSRSSLKYLFTGPDAPKEPADPKNKWDKKPDVRKFKVGDREYTSDTHTDIYVDGKLLSKSWSTKELPEGVVLFTESPDGKVTTRLVDFKRKAK